MARSDSRPENLPVLLGKPTVAALPLYLRGSQRNDRIHAARPPRGARGGGESRGDEDGHHAAQRGRLVRVHHHYRRQPPARIDGATTPGTAPTTTVRSVSSITTRSTSAGPLTEREPDANLPRPLRHRVGDDAVQADDGEQERQPGERAGHDRAKPLGSGALRQRAPPSSPRRSTRCRRSIDFARSWNSARTAAAGRSVLSRSQVLPRTTWRRGT